MAGQAETAEIRTVWKEKPSLLSKGMIHWVLQTGPAGEPTIIRESVAFPLDDAFVTADDPDSDDPFLRIHVDDMDEEKRQVVDKMHSEFVASLERDGWTPLGQGVDRHNLRLSRHAAAEDVTSE